MVVVEDEGEREGGGGGGRWISILILLFALAFVFVFLGRYPECCKAALHLSFLVFVFPFLVFGVWGSVLEFGIFCLLLFFLFACLLAVVVPTAESWSMGCDRIPRHVRLGGVGAS